MGDRLLLNTPWESQTHKHLKRNPRLSVCVEDGYRYITLTGSVTLDENPTQVSADHEKLGRRYSSTFLSRPVIPASDAGEGAAKLAEYLSCERVTLWMQIGKVISKGFS